VGENSTTAFNTSMQADLAAGSGNGIDNSNARRTP